MNLNVNPNATNMRLFGWNMLQFKWRWSKKCKRYRGSKSKPSYPLRKNCGFINRTIGQNLSPTLTIITIAIYRDKLDDMLTKYPQKYP